MQQEKVVGLFEVGVHWEGENSQNDKKVVRAKKMYMNIFNSLQ